MKKNYIIYSSDGSSGSYIEGVFDSKELAINELKVLVKNTNAVIKSSKDIAWIKLGSKYKKLDDNYKKHNGKVILSYGNRFNSVYLIEYSLNKLPKKKVLSAYSYHL